MNPVPITLLYAGLLGLLMAVLSIRVPIRRAEIDVPWGSGGDETLGARIRVFGNFTEYVPAILLLMMLVEGAGAPANLLHLAGVGLLFARLVHAFSLRAKDCLTLKEKLGRGVGAMSNWLILAGLAGYAAYLGLEAFT